MANLNNRSYPKGLREIRYPSNDIIHRFTSKDYTGEIKLNNETGLFEFNPALEGTGSSSGTTFTVGQDGHGFSVGQPLYHNGVKFALANASAATTLALWVVTATPSVDTFTAAQSGRFEIADHGLIAGNFYYVGETDGSLTPTEPDTYSNPIIYVESDSVYHVLPFRPSSTTSGGGGGGAVTSVFGRTGVVTAETGDYTNDQVGLGNVLNVEQIPVSEKAASNGVATLGSDGKVPTSQLPAAVAGGINIIGFWNADTNTPDLSSLTLTEGQAYQVSTAGTTDLNGILSWSLFDLAVWDNTISGNWFKLSSAGQVTSVNTLTGAVVLTTDEIAEGTNLYYSDALVSANSSVVLNTVKVSADASIDTHSDVDTTSIAPTVDQTLKWDGSNWVPGAAPQTTFSDAEFRVFDETTLNEKIDVLDNYTANRSVTWPDKSITVAGIDDLQNIYQAVITSISDLDAAILAATQGDWVILSDITLDANKTLPSNVTLHFRNKAKITFGTFNLTGVNSKINANLIQIFNYNSTGSLDGTWIVDKYKSEWYGMVDGTDITTTFQRVIDSFTFVANQQIIGLKFGKGSFDISSTITFPMNGSVFCFEGAGILETIFNLTGSSDISLFKIINAKYSTFKKFTLFNFLSTSDIGTGLEIHQNGDGGNSFANTFEDIIIGSFGTLRKFDKAIKMTCTSGFDINNERHDFTRVSILNVINGISVEHTNSLWHTFNECRVDGCEVLGTNIPDPATALTIGTGGSFAFDHLTATGTILAFKMIGGRYSSHVINSVMEGIEQLIEFEGHDSGVVSGFNFSDTNITGGVGVGEIDTRPWIKITSQSAQDSNNVIFRNTNFTLGNGGLVEISGQTLELIDVIFNGLKVDVFGGFIRKRSGSLLQLRTQTGGYIDAQDSVTQSSVALFDGVFIDSTGTKGVARTYVQHATDWVYRTNFTKDNFQRGNPIEVITSGPGGYLLIYPNLNMDYGIELDENRRGPIKIQSGIEFYPQFDDGSAVQKVRARIIGQQRNLKTDTLYLDEGQLMTDGTIVTTRGWTILPTSWAASTSYSKHDIKERNGGFYVAIQDVAADIDPEVEWNAGAGLSRDLRDAVNWVKLEFVNSNLAVYSV